MTVTLEQPAPSSFARHGHFMQSLSAMSAAGSASLNWTGHDMSRVNGGPKPGEELRCRRQHQGDPLTPSSPTRNSLPCEGRFSDPARRFKTALGRSRNLLDVYCTPTRSSTVCYRNVRQSSLVRSSTLKRSIQGNVPSSGQCGPGHDWTMKFSGTSSSCSWTAGTANVRASSGPIFRICHEGEQSGPLLSYCLCSGTMGLVLDSCLERWLCSSNTDICELCHHQFPTILHRRPSKEWISEDAHRRALMADVLCFALLSPVTVLGSELCVRDASQQASSRHVWQMFEDAAKGREDLTTTFLGVALPKQVESKYADTAALLGDLRKFTEVLILQTHITPWSSVTSRGNCKIYPASSWSQSTDHPSFARAAGTIKAMKDPVVHVAVSFTMGVTAFAVDTGAVNPTNARWGDNCVYNTIFSYEDLCYQGAQTSYDAATMTVRASYSGPPAVLSLDTVESATKKLKKLWGEAKKADIGTMLVDVQLDFIEKCTSRKAFDRVKRIADATHAQSPSP